MPALTLPPSFSNSFWSQDYRRGLETIYGKLEQGLTENLEVFSFIKARALTENELGNALIAAAPTGRRGIGFDADDGATLLMTFRALQSESQNQGEAHKTVAKDLASLVADPFGQWASGHAGRVTESRQTIVEGWLAAYELAKSEVEVLKQGYLNKTRRADEAADDAKFAPSSTVQDPYTSSPKMSPVDRPAKRTASVSERISQRFKELRKNLSEKEDDDRDEKKPLSPASSVGKSEADEKDALANSSRDKGKGKEVVTPPRMESPTPLSPQQLSSPLPARPDTLQTPASGLPLSPAPPVPIVLGGLALPPQVVSQLLTQAASEMPLRKVRFPILGEYSDCFSGEEFVTWLKDNVEGFGGSLDRAEDAAVDLAERENVLRRIGELGNRFENSKDAYFQFRSKAFELHFAPDVLPEQQTALTPVAENLMKRTSNFVSIVQKAVSSANAVSSEPFYVRARREAEEADRLYRVAVRKLDRQRLAFEEKVEETLKVLQRWETERLRAVKTALLQYQGTLANLPHSLTSSFERSSIAISSYQPDNDLIALIERYRTGPFRPNPHVYESIAHDQPDIVFGIDLRTWAGEGGWNAVRANEEQKEHEKQDLVPNIVIDLLGGLNEAYKKQPSDDERRKAWIYEVPLPAVHHLREAINALPHNAHIPAALLEKYDAPVLASTIKLWALELDPPLALWESWDDIRKLYPTIGSSGAAEVSERQRLDDLQTVLLKLPKIHLLVLDTIIKHIRNLIDTSQSEESDEVYVTKLGLSLGRSILRPRLESEISIQDRHPTLLFMDLVSHYEAILPKVISQKKRESIRPIPTRKRTKMVDQRLSRSKITYEVDPRQLLAAQHAAQHGPSSRSTSPVPQADQRKMEQVVPPPPRKTGVHVSPPPLQPPPPPPPEVVEQLSTIRSVPPVPPPPPVISPNKPIGTYVPPPRPVFAEETPEGAYVAPPRPTFVEPPPEEVPSEKVIVSPPTPVRTQSPVSPTSNSPLESPSKGDVEDKALGSMSSLTRSGSSDASRVKGPRGARAPPKPSSSGGVSSPTTASRVSSGHQHTHSRGGSSVSLSPEQAQQYAPKRHGGKANAALFSRRTVASDAEDNILDK